MGDEPEIGSTVPKVSVCIPAYKSRHLRHTINSVLAQTFDDFELLVVDDAPSNDIAEIIAGYSDWRLRYYRNERNLGLVGNWNRCLSLAQGEYIAVLHDDDFWSPHLLEREVAALDTHANVGLVYSACYLVEARGKIQKVHAPWPWDCILASRSEFLHLLTGNYIYPPTVIIRRCCYEAVGGFNEGLVHQADWELFLRLSLRYDFAYIAEPLAFYRLHAQSVSAQFARHEKVVIKYDEAINIVRTALALGKVRGLEPERSFPKIRMFLARLECAVSIELHRMGDLDASRRRAKQAIGLYPFIVLRRPLVFAVLLFSSVLNPRVVSPLYTLEDWFIRTVAEGEIDRLYNP